MIYELYGLLHKTAKKVLRGEIKSQYRFVNLPLSEITNGVFPVLKEDAYSFFNDTYDNVSEIALGDLFPLENTVKNGSFPRLKDSYKHLSRSASKITLGVTPDNSTDAWREFIINSTIPSDYRYAGLSYAGFILEAQSWCLPSWIWTNAALVRMHCKQNNISEAKRIADILASKQTSEGGWVVRFDYDEKGAVPVLAPNDSAYIANNCFLEIYKKTKDDSYLSIAERCADWIMRTARPDGMVYVGYNMRDSFWQKKHNIVDVGFTGGLFSNLYALTGKSKYYDFLKCFIKKYIELYYIKEKGFATSLDENDNKMGGMFGRGQAWALEGLIPFYAIEQTLELKHIINKTVDMLIKTQRKDGAWPYNLTRKLMGNDCKATSVIAYNLMKWSRFAPERTDCIKASIKALKWCEKHTAAEGTAKGGIFSYSTEGSIVHNMYSSTAFVYSTAYAIELAKRIRER